MRGLSPLLRADQKISEYFAAHDSRWLKELFRAFSSLGAGAVWISVYILCLIFLRDHVRGLILSLIVAELIGLSVIIILRYMVKRKRPDENYKCFYLTPWNRYSFPSHHTFRAFMVAIIIGMSYPGLFPLLIIMAALVGFSRIYLSKHYFSDVLAGLLLATAVAPASQSLV